MTKELTMITKSLKRGDDLVVATIVRQQGSTPRKAGSKMVVLKDGTICGTIGGGEVEADVLDQAQQALKDGRSRLLSYDYRRTGPGDRIDLICGGRMDLLLEFVTANETNKQLYDQALTQLFCGEGCRWRIKTTEADGQMVVDRQLHVLPEETRPLVSELKAERYDNGWQIEEAMFPGRQLYLVGAGHVGRELARLTIHLDLPTHIFDDRAELLQTEALAGAATLNVVAEYDDVFTGRRLSSGDCIVITTRAHRYDQKVLAQALQTGAGYVGMIGSRKKRDTIYAQLVADGVEKSALARVACPIGLNLGGESPEEIAVSIAAELIQFRAGLYSRG